MFIRKNWLPITVFIVAIVGVGIYYLQTRPTKEPITITKPTEVEKPPAETAPDAQQGGHFHADGTWHEGPHANETQRAQSPQLPETALEGHASDSVPVDPWDFSAAYQALREKYPDQTQNPHPFEDVPVDLWDFEATKKAFQDHFKFYVEQGGNKPEVFENNREVRIAAAIMANIHNAAKPWFGLFTPEQCEEIKEMRRSYREFNGVKVNHDRVWELVHDEGYSVSEALRISREEGSNR